MQNGKLNMQNKSGDQEKIAIIHFTDKAWATTTSNLIDLCEVSNPQPG